jgi:hypothetical protein
MIGKTGRFLEVAHNNRGEVIVNLGDASGWIAFSPAQARDLSMTLARKATVAEELDRDAVDYLPVDVEAAIEIADRYRKAIVVIVAWDDRFGRSHFTTYGRRPEQKAFAAQLGDRLPALLGLDKADQEKFRDFRDIEASEWSARTEGLVNACKSAWNALASVLACRTGITDDCLIECIETLKSAVAKGGGY